MKISCCFLYVISKYGYPPGIENLYKALKEIKNMGFDYAELEGVREKNLKEVYKEKKNLKKFCDEINLKIVNFCPIIPEIVSFDKIKRKKAKELFKLGVEIAKFFNCETIQTDSYTPPLKFKGDIPYKEAISFGKEFKIEISKKFKWSKLWDILVESMSFCAEYSKKYNLKFCLEMRVGEIISNTDSLLLLMRDVNNENFGAVLDTGHLHAQKEILPLSIEKLGKKIFYLHLSDNDGRDNKHLGLGKGTIDWEGVFLALKKFKFSGYVAIDIGGVPDIEKEYINSKKFLEDLEKKLFKFR
jgi:sugar phosphate isomerase/epimerase